MNASVSNHRQTATQACIPPNIDQPQSTTNVTPSVQKANRYCLPSCEALRAADHASRRCSRAAHIMSPRNISDAPICWATMTGNSVSRSPRPGGPGFQPTAQPTTASSLANAQKTQMLIGTSRLQRKEKPIRQK